MIRLSWLWFRIVTRTSRSIRHWCERSARRRFEAKHDTIAETCENCRQPFSLDDTDIMLTFDDCWLCKACANVMRTEAVAS